MEWRYETNNSTFDFNGPLSVVDLQAVQRNMYQNPRHKASHTEDRHYTLLELQHYSLHHNSTSHDSYSFDFLHRPNFFHSFFAKIS
jgi:hypothetical protein